MLRPSIQLGVALSALMATAPSQHFSGIEGMAVSRHLIDAMLGQSSNLGAIISLPEKSSANYADPAGTLTFSMRS